MAENNIAAPPVWIDCPENLLAMIKQLAQEPIIAVDTESNSLFAYQEQVCLIQFSSASVDYLVDPLAIKDLSALGSLFADERIEKVFHAAEYDVICLKRDFGFTFTNLFDTMLGARTLGWRRLGLGTLLETHFGVAVNKKYQRANWGKRPLGKDELDYARTDTHYLIELRNLIHDKLVEMGRWEMAQENFRQMTQVEETIQGDPVVNAWYSCLPRGFSPRQATVLFELCRYREEEARRLNRPSFKVFGKEVLTAIAAACPNNLGELEESGRLSRHQYERYGQALLSAVKRGMKAPLLSTKRLNHHYDEAIHNNLEALRSWRKNQAQMLDVESDVVLTKDVLQKIAEEAPQDLKSLQSLMKDVPERYEQFGAEILAVLELQNDSEKEMT